MDRNPRNCPLPMLAYPPILHVLGDGHHAYKRESDKFDNADDIVNCVRVFLPIYCLIVVRKIDEVIFISFLKINNDSDLHIECGVWMNDSVGTVLGFVISYRTTSSFERYNEGRRYWSQIILGSRTLARAVWFHVPGESCVVPSLLTN